MPQERYNAEWVTENGFGIVVRNFREIAPAVHRLLQSTALNEFRRKANEYSNRALFEVPVILEKCAEHKTPSTPPQVIV
jgi:UDP-N-acetylglucosamine:LPS N-acetylglucosamine transferase